MSPSKKNANQPFNATRRKVLIVSPGIPHPKRGASTVLFFCYIDAMKKAGFEILHLLLLQPGSAKTEELNNYTDSIQELRRFKVLPCWSDVFIQSGRLGHNLNQQAVQQVREEVEEFQADMIISFDLMSAWSSVIFSCDRKIVWLGDLNYDSYWYNSLYSWKEGNSKPWHLLWAVIQRWSWERIYKKVLFNFDSIIVSSYSSEKSLVKFGIKSLYLPYPWPNPFIEQRKSRTRPNTPTFLFFGTLSALGSRSALHMLVDKVYPRLIKTFGAQNFKINICGQKEFPTWATDSISGKPEIAFLGFVDDLGKLMDSCHAMIAPIDVPVGNRSRILTALACRLPVIAHHNTALGNPGLIHNETCLLASTPDEFVVAMRRAVDNPEDIQKIADVGCEYYKNNFAPAAASSIFLQEIIK